MNPSNKQMTERDKVNQAIELIVDIGLDEEYPFEKRAAVEDCLDNLRDLLKRVKRK